MATPRKSGASKVDAVAPPVAERAGTKLDHKFARPILGPYVTGGSPGKLATYGHIDPSNRIYQTGGPLDKWFLFRDKTVTMSILAWRAVVDSMMVDYLEFIEWRANTVWRCSLAAAQKYGKEYDAGAGPRWGIQVGAFTVTDRHGAIVRQATLS